MKRRIYLSGAFTNVDWTQTSEYYVKIGELLFQNGFDVYLPHTNTPPTLIEGISTKEVFLKDYREIKNSQIVLAVLDNPSHGVGAEIALALNLGLTVVGVSLSNIKISRFIVGLLQTHKNGHYFSFRNLDEIPFNLTKIVESSENLEAPSVYLGQIEV